MNRRLNLDRWPLDGPRPRHPRTTTTPTLRASDDDREQTANRLRYAAAEGRLHADELEDRLAAAFSAKTYGELDALVSDLPRSMAPGRRRLVERVRLRPAIALAVALLIALVLIAGALGLGIHRSSAAAPDQPRPPVSSDVGPS
jgi:DUF1707 SHOCT-like domain